MATKLTVNDTLGIPFGVKKHKTSDALPNSKIKASSSEGQSSTTSKVTAYSVPKRHGSSKKASSAKIGKVQKSETPVGADAWKERTFQADGINFVNVPSQEELKQSTRRQPQQPETPAKLVPIDKNDILSKCHESSPARIYEIDLHACSAGRIENLDSFTKLRVLDLSSNYIKAIENLDFNTDLRELKMYDNQLSEIQNLERLKELSHLQLQHNKIQVIGKGLSGLRKLKVLRLDNNRLIKLDVRELASCGMLTYIDVSSNHISNLSALSSLQNLQELYAIHNRLRVIHDLSRCKQLQEVDVSYNQLTDLSGLRGLSNLKILHVAFNQLTSLKSLGKLKSLEELNISHNQLQELGSLVQMFPSLQILDISHNHIQDWDETCVLSSLGELVELSVAGNPFTLEEGEQLNYHPEMHNILPQLEVLDGVTMRRPSSRAGTPLMRPMSAASVVSSRQVENQLKSMEADLQNFAASFEERFSSLRKDMERLPFHSPAHEKSQETDPSSSKRTADVQQRPVSRSGKRSRIKDAQEYAASHF